MKLTPKTARLLVDRLNMLNSTPRKVEAQNGIFEVKLKYVVSRKCTISIYIEPIGFTDLRPNSDIFKQIFSVKKSRDSILQSCAENRFKQDAKILGILGEIKLERIYLKNTKLLKQMVCS